MDLTSPVVVIVIVLPLFLPFPSSRMGKPFTAIIGKFRQRQILTRGPLMNAMRCNQSNINNQECLTKFVPSRSYPLWLYNGAVDCVGETDGANVAYYMQNFDKGGFNFHQIQFVVDAIEARNENPLVVLPNKYAKPTFTFVRGNQMVKQIMSPAEKQIRDELQSNGKLYFAPPYCLDDYYWMFASVSDQVTARGGRDLDVAPGDAQGRVPGTRPMLITNDQMRDHKLSLLEPRLFRRWYASHIVNYAFTGFVGHQRVDDKISFHPVDFFSNEIQNHPSPAVGQDGSDSSTSSVGTAWHFPVSDWEDNERLCIRIPSTEQEIAE